MPHPPPEPPLAALLDGLLYDLPEDRIARLPLPERDGARLLRVGLEGVEDRRVQELPALLAPGDLLVVNDTRVLPARIFAHRRSGGRIELLILPTSRGEAGPEGEPVDALVRPARRLREAEALEVEGGGALTVLSRYREGPLAEGGFRVALRPGLFELLERAGHMPLPPYLGRADQDLDRERYQTVFAGPPGAVAAPTAGLHLSEALLAALDTRGVGLARVTLHVGPGTFRPLRPEDLARGRLHAETWELSEATAREIAACRQRGGRVVAVGTTSTRVLESAALPGGLVAPGRGETELFLRPGAAFRVVDRLLTNLHLPGSSLLALVQAFAGVARTQAAYRAAIALGYRFYSYGDAMLLDLEPPRSPA